MVIKVEFHISTKYVGSEVREIVEIELDDDDYTQEEIEDIVNDEYQEWLHNVTYQGWTIKDTIE